MIRSTIRSIDRDATKCVFLTLCRCLQTQNTDLRLTTRQQLFKKLTNVTIRMV